MPQPGVSEKDRTGRRGGSPCDRIRRCARRKDEWSAGPANKQAISRRRSSGSPQNLIAPAPEAVSVPVLSKTTVSTRASVSMTAAFLRKTLRRARTRWAVPSAKGAARARAQGQATINTDTNEPSARDGSRHGPEQAGAAGHGEDNACVKCRL